MTTYAMTTLLLLALLAAPAIAAEGSKIRVSDVPTDQDTSIVIRKGAEGDLRDFEVVSGTEDVTGEPTPTHRESYASWKQACDAWKKEMREMNKENSLIALNCNVALASKDPAGLSTHHSTGSYKLRVRIRAPR